MSDEPTTTRSRRSVLAAVLGAAAASVAAAVGRPRPAAAAENDPIVVGGEHAGALSPTGITTTTPFAPGTPSAAFYASTTTSGVYGLRGISTAAAGVRGESTSSVGVHGKSTGGTGVWGEGFSNSGVYATSVEYHAVVARAFAANRTAVAGEVVQTSGIAITGAASNAAGTSIGVRGLSNGDQGYGVVGWSGGGAVGVLGFSAATDGVSVPAAPAKTGVYGSSSQGTSSRGVHGYSPSGRGVYGQATSGVGVYASATTGYAIRSTGRVRLDKSAGIATLGAAATSVTVTPGIVLTSNSAITATLMSDAGAVLVKRVSVNTAAGTFTVHFTASAPLGTKVAWHVFG